MNLEMAEDEDYDNISLNSSDEEDDGDGDFFVEDVLAEKTSADGTKLYLVSWEEYSEEHHSWIPEINFNHPETLQRWSIKKQRIRDGLESSYPWQEWDRRNELRQSRLAVEKERRQELREIKRAALGAEKRHGQWVVPPKRPRARDDQTYNEFEDDEYRPPKRLNFSSPSDTSTTTSGGEDSDSDSDSRPLLVVRKEKTSARESQEQPQQMQASVSGDAGPTTRQPGRALASIPFRPSQSPMRSQPKDTTSGTPSGELPTAVMLDRLLPPVTSPSTTQEPPDLSSARPANAATTHSQSLSKTKKTKSIVPDESRSKQASNGKSKEASLPAHQELHVATIHAFTGRVQVSEPLKRKASELIDLEDPVEQTANAQSSSIIRPPMTKTNVPRTKQTARRSIKPKDQNIFNRTGKAVSRPARRVSLYQAPNVPLMRDFHATARVAWHAELRGRDEGVPQAEDLDLQPAKDSTGFPNKAFDSIRGTAQAFPPSRRSAAGPNTTTPDQGHELQGTALEDSNKRKEDISSRAQFAQPFTEATPEPSLFVSQDLTMMDVDSAPQTMDTASADAMANNKGRESKDFPHDIDHASRKSGILNASVQSITRSAPINDKHGDIASHTQTIQAKTPSMSNFERIPTGPLAHSKSNFTTIKKDKIRDLRIGTFAYLETKRDEIIHQRLRPTQCRLFHPVSGTTERGVVTGVIADLKRGADSMLLDTAYIRKNGIRMVLLEVDQLFKRLQSFEQSYHREGDHIYYAAGTIDVPGWLPKSQDSAWTSITDHFGLLIWPLTLEGDDWQGLTKQVLPPQSNLNKLGFIMFDARRSLKFATATSAAKQISAPKVDVDASEMILTPAASNQIQILGQSQQSLQDKGMMLSKILATPSSWAGPVTDSRCQTIYRELTLAMASAKQASSAADMEADGGPQLKTSSISVAPTEDPRRRNSKLYLMESSPGSPDSAIPAFPTAVAEPFEELKKKWAVVPKSDVVIAFKQIFNFDWHFVSRRATETKKMAIQIHYPQDAEGLKDELDILEEFLSIMKTRIYVTSAEDTEDFDKQVKYTSTSVQKDDTDKPADGPSHYKCYGGKPGIIFLHESVDIRGLLRTNWNGRLRNPNFRIYRISLGQSYNQSVASQIPSTPRIREIAGHGAHLLLDDSLIRKCPKQLCSFVKYIKRKWNPEDWQSWRICTRPGLARWLLDLGTICTIEERQREYAELYGEIEDLVPNDLRSTTEDGNWEPLETAPLVMPHDLSQYNLRCDSELSEHDIQKNDYVLTEWFAKETRSMVEDVREFFVVSSEPVTEMQKRFSKYRHLTFCWNVWLHDYLRYQAE